MSSNKSNDASTLGLRLKPAQTELQRESYYARNRDKRKEYQREYHARTRGPGKRRKVAKRPKMPLTSTTTEQDSLPPPSAHTASTGSARPESTLPPAASHPSPANIVAHLDQSDHEKCPHPQRLVDLGPNWQFYRFSVGIKKEVSEARYDNDWTISRGYTHDGFAPDVDRTDKMAEDEAQLALDLSLNEKVARQTYHDSWVSEFIKDLKRWALDEYKEAGRTLRDDTGPFRERHLHAHCRLIAIFEQEIDLLQQGIQDSAAASLTWPVDAYIRHSVCSGTAIITGAEVNRKHFKKKYGF